MSGDVTEKADLTTIMATPSGRRFMWNLVEACGVLDASFAGDERMTAYNEGRRSVGIELVQRLQAVTPDAYLKMVVEQATLAAEEGLRRQAAEAQLPKPPADE